MTKEDLKIRSCINWVHDMTYHMTDARDNMDICHYFGTVAIEVKKRIRLSVGRGSDLRPWEIY